jgi:hypothetical protein
MRRVRRETIIEPQSGTVAIEGYLHFKHEILVQKNNFHFRLLPAELISNTWQITIGNFADFLGGSLTLLTIDIDYE